MATRQNESIAVGPSRILRIEDQVIGKQLNRQSGLPHRRAWVAAVRLFDSINAEEANRIDRSRKGGIRGGLRKGGDPGTR